MQCRLRTKRSRNKFTSQNERRSFKIQSDIAAVSGSSTSTSNQTFETAEEVEFNPNPALKSSADNASGECMEGHDFTRKKRRIRFSPIVREKQYIVSKAPIDRNGGNKAFKGCGGTKKNTHNEVFDDRENIPVNTQFEEFIYVHSLLFI